MRIHYSASSGFVGWFLVIGQLIAGIYFHATGILPVIVEVLYVGSIGARNFMIVVHVVL